MLKLKTGSNTGSDTLSRDPTWPGQNHWPRDPELWFHLCCGVQEQSPEDDEPFVHFHTKERPKVKDLTDSSPPCLKQTATHSTWPATTFGQWGQPGSAPVTTEFLYSHAQIHQQSFIECWIQQLKIIQNIVLLMHNFSLKLHQLICNA